MKKRCTSSACRKVFRQGPVCPFCGKNYPRIKKVENKSELLARRIEELYLSVRAFNNLKRANIHTVRDLVSKSETELLQTTKCSRTVVLELRDKLHTIGLNFAQESKSNRTK